MATDWLPKSSLNLRDWAQNLTTTLPEVAAGLGLSEPEKTALLAIAAQLQTLAQTVIDRQNDLDVAEGALATYVGEKCADLRRRVGAIKKLAGYNQGIGDVLDITSSGSEFDPNTYKPTITAAAFTGRVRIDGKKRGVAAMNIYGRLRGQPGWKLIGARRSRFPFDDDAPLAQPGVPETREYQAIGVVDDNEIGQPSDIASVTFGG